MVTKIKNEKVIIEGEWHISGDFCWCNSFRGNDGDFKHYMTMEKGKTQDQDGNC